MLKRFCHGVLLLAVVGLVSGLGSATQVTLSESAQALTFTGTASGADVTFTTLSGNGLFGTDHGHYTMTLSSGPISLVPSSPFNPDMDDVASGSWVLSLTFTDVTNPGTFSGTWNLDVLSSATTRVPQFIGSVLVTSGTNQFQNWVGTTLDGDFTINLGRHPTVSQIFQNVGAQTSGNISSGELVPTPEPGTLGLLGSGLLAFAGVLRRYFI